jgi:NitT/TauT family transport system substrate-binding protein
VENQNQTSGPADLTAAEVPQESVTPPLSDPTSAPEQFASPTQPPPSLPDDTPKSRKWVVVTLFVIVILGVAGILAALHKHSAKTPDAKSLTKVSVRLEWVNNPEFVGMYVAQDKGFYREKGLNVDLKEYTESADVNKEVSNGQVDFGVSTPLEVILARDHNYNNKAIAAIYQTSPFSITTLKSANIKTPADFKGKILGDTGGNNEAKVSYAVLMANAGLQLTDATVKTVDFDPLTVLKNNEAMTADVYRNDQTYELNQAGIQYDQIFPEQYGFNIYGDVLIASDSKIKNNPAEVAAFTSATLKGWQYVLTHKEEALTIMARHASPTYKDPAYQKYVLNSTLPFIQPTGNQPLGNMQYVYWNAAYNGVREAGMLHSNFDVSDVYTTQFVR